MKSLYILPVLFLIFSISCSTHPSVKFLKKSPDSQIKTKSENKYFSLTDRLFLSRGEDKSYPLMNNKKINQYSVRYFSSPFTSSVIFELNQTGVNYALNGDIEKARIIFSEVLEEDKSFSPAFNNLAIVCELLNIPEKAFYYYSKACIADPDNKFYKHNFLSFTDNSSKSIINPFGNIYE